RPREAVSRPGSANDRGAQARCDSPCAPDSHDGDRDDSRAPADGDRDHRRGRVHLPAARGGRDRRIVLLHRDDPARAPGDLSPRGVNRPPWGDSGGGGLSVSSSVINSRWFSTARSRPVRLIRTYTPRIVKPANRWNGESTADHVATTVVSPQAALSLQKVDTGAKMVRTTTA